MKKLFQVFLLLLLSYLSFNLVSCSNSKDLYILNWDEYIDEDLIEEFEQLYDCNIMVCRIN